MPGQATFLLTTGVFAGESSPGTNSAPRMDASGSPERITFAHESARKLL